MSQRPHSRSATAAIAVLAAASMFATLPGTAAAAESTAKSPAASQQRSKEALAKLVANKGYVSKKIREAQGTTAAFVQLVQQSGLEKKAEKLNGKLSLSANQEKSANQEAQASANKASRVAASVEAELKKLDPQAKVQYTTSYAISGLAVQADSQALFKLARNSSQVLRVVPLPQHTASVAGDPDMKGATVSGGPESPQNKNSDNLVRAVNAWSQTGKTGKGVNVAIVDTGLDYTHADFGGAGTTDAYKSAYAAQDQDPLTNPVLKGLFDPAKFKGGYDFAGANYGSQGANGKKITTPTPDPNPIDGSGGHHGTHVAGTSLGFGVNADGTTFRGDYTKLTNGYVSGMRIGPGSAPQAGVYALKVFGDNGGSTGLTLEALDWIAKHNLTASEEDKISLVSMSLGGSFGTPDDPENDAVDNLAANGVLSVIAAGNDGDITDMLGDPGGARSALTVAASSSGKTVQDALRVDEGPASLKGQLLAGQYSANLSGDFDVESTEVVRVKDSANLDGCSAYSDEDKARVAGKIAYVEWDDKDVKCGSGKRFNNAEAAGAVGILFASQSNIPEAGIGGNATLPGLQLVKSAAQNEELQKAIDDGTLKVTLASSLKHAKDADYSAEFEDTVASFTSRGLHGSHDGTVKPDVAAPGVGIISASAESGNQFEVMSGTSMATPLTSGIAALVREAHPNFTAQQVKAQIVNTADHDVLNATRSAAEAPIRVGTGRVDALAAVNNQVQISSTDTEAVTVQFGVLQVPQAGLTQTKELVVSNNSDVERSYRAEYLARTETPGVSYTLSANQVTVPAHGTAKLSVTLKADQAALRHTLDKNMEPQVLGGDRAYVTDASGVVKLTPVSPAVGSDPAAVGLRVAVSSAPRPLSETETSLKGLNAGGKLTLSGHGVNQGEGKEAYQSKLYPMVMVADDPVNAYSGDLNTNGQISKASGDLRAIGYSSTAPQLDDPSQGTFSVGIVTDKAWSNFYTSAMWPSIFFDVNGDDDPDYQIEINTTNDNDKNLDRAEAVTYNLSTNEVVDVEPIDKEFLFDSNQLVLSTKLSALGFTKDTKNPSINFLVATRSLYVPSSEHYFIDIHGLDKTTTVNPYAPALSFGPLSEQGKKAMADAKAAASSSSTPAPSKPGTGSEKPGSRASKKAGTQAARRATSARTADTKEGSASVEPVSDPAAQAPGQVSFDDQDGQSVKVSTGSSAQDLRVLSIHNLGKTALRAEDQAQPDVDSLSAVDPQKLQDAIDQYSQLNKDAWTSTSYAELQKQLEAAKAVLADPNADQQAIDDAYQALLTAYNGLVARASGVSRDRLQAAVGAAGKLNPGDYTDETSQALQDALKAAQDVLANPDATQEDVDNALDALLKAMDALEKKPAEQPGKDQKPGQPSEPGKPGQPSEPGKPAEPGKGGKQAAKPQVVAQASRSRLGETGASANLIALGALVLLATGSALTLIRRKNHTKVADEEE